MLGDTSTTAPSTSDQHDDADLTVQHDDSYLSVVEGSFMFDGQHGASSTPLPGRSGPSHRQRIEHDSLEDSLGSPFDRVDRRLGDDYEGEDSSDMPTPSLPSGYSLPEFVETDYQRQTEPVEGTTPRANNRRPFQPDPAGANWNGLTDLRTTPLNAGFYKGKRPASKPRHPRSSLANTIGDMSLDSDGHLPMSPPVTMTWNLPPRAQAVFNAGKTPVKGSKADAGGKGQEVEARRILDDLMEEMQHGYEPSPRMPTPEGLGRYSVVPDMDVGGPQRLFADAPSGTGAAPETSRQARNLRRSMANTSFGSDIVDEDQQPTPVIGDDESLEMEEDSFDSAFGPPTTGHPGMPGIVGHDGDLLGDMDDSFMSTPGRGNEMMTQRSEAGALFGGPQALDGRSSGNHLGAGDGSGRGLFALHKQDEMVTFHGGKLEDAAGDAEMRHSPLGRGEMGRDLLSGQAKAAMRDK